MPDHFSKKTVWNDRKNKNMNATGSDEGGDASGNIVLSAEHFSNYLNASLLKKIRLTHSKVAPVPYTEDPNRFLCPKSPVSSVTCDEAPKAHPLLSKCQRFSGDDPSVTPDPSTSDPARARFPELRNENQLRKIASLGKSKSVRLRRG